MHASSDSTLQPHVQVTSKICSCYVQNVPLRGWTECRCCLLGCHACMPTVPDHSQVPVVIAAYERVDHRL